MRKSLSPVELGFRGRDRRRLSQALVEAVQARFFRRIQAVLLVARGQSFAQAAQTTELSLRSTYRLVARYLSSHRVADLKDRPRSGRPAAAPELTGDQILGELHRCPLKLGYRTNVWTVATLAKHLSEKYECSLGPFALRQRMKVMGLVYKRPRYFYSEKEPHRAQKKGGHRAQIAPPAAQGRAAL